MLRPGKRHSVRLCATFVRTVSVPGWTDPTAIHRLQGRTALLGELAQSIDPELRRYGEGQKVAAARIALFLLAPADDGAPQAGKHVRRIVRDAAADDYAWSSIVLGVVESPAFLMRTAGQEVAAN